MLWLERAVEAEGPVRSLVAQTLVNRWAYLLDTMPGAYPTLTSLIRAYAQPVNPGWFPRGELLEAAIKAPVRLPGGGHRPKTAAELAQARAELEPIAVRRRDVHSTRTQFSPETIAAVNQALRGPITIPAGAVHYAASWAHRPDLPLLYAGKKGENSLWGAGPGKGVGALYHFLTQGPAFQAAATLNERPHAVFAFLFLTAGGLFAMANRRRKR